jgi:hypothetical protein
MKVIWHFTRLGIGSSTVSPLDDAPKIMAMDSNNQREFYVFGKFRTGSTSA